MALRFTASRDGMKRATIVVRVRLGIDALEVAATSIVWTKMVDTGSTSPGDDAWNDAIPGLVDSLTRGRIELELRVMAEQSGYRLFDVGEDDFYDAVAQAVVARVAELFPEAAS